MNLVRLNKATRQPDALVESWSTLIWTERYSDASDFTLTSAAIEYTENIIPVDSWVSLLDTDEIMVVENHSLSTDDDDVQILTVSGRSLAKVLLESRAMVISDDPSSPDYTTYSPGKYVTDIINRRVAYMNIGGVLYQADLVGDRVDYCYAVDTTDFQGPSAPTSPFPDTFSPGDAASLVYGTLQQYQLGLSLTRPADPASSVMAFRVYIGYDRRANAQTNNPYLAAPPVLLHFGLGDLVGYSYLNSSQDERNIAYVNSPLGFGIVLPSGVTVEPTGTNRRVLQVEASDLTDSGNLSDAEAIAVRGRTELSKHNRASILDGTLSPTNKYVFRGPNTNAKYDLGDTISLLGKANVTADRRVTEYIRSQDKNGEKGYPTLVALDDSTAA